MLQYFPILQLHQIISMLLVQPARSPFEVIAWLHAKWLEPMVVSSPIKLQTILCIYKVFEGFKNQFMYLDILKLNYHLCFCHP